MRFVPEIAAQRAAGGADVFLAAGTSLASPSRAATASNAASAVRMSSCSAMSTDVDESSGSGDG